MAALAWRRDIRPLPPPADGQVVDLGCGRGELVSLMHEEGLEAEGIGITRERAAHLCAAGVARARQGDFRFYPRACRALGLSIPCRL